MRHNVIIKDYGFNEYTIAEGWGNIIVGNVELRVFIGGMKLPNILYKEDCRGKEMEVDLRILSGYITAIEIKKKTILRLTREDTLVPKYLFIGEVIEKAVKGSDEITIVFDCGVRLDVNVKKRYSFEKLKRGDYVLVIGFLHMYGAEDGKVFQGERSNH